MKWFLFVLISCLLLIADQSYAVDIPPSSEGSTYSGKITGVAIDFYYHTGIGLPDGETCNGKPAIVLLKTHPRYKEILSVLLIAESTGKTVEIYGLGQELSDFGAGYCVVKFASLGNFPLW